MRVILQRDLIISGSHRKKGETVECPKDQFHYLKNNGAVIAANRDEAVRLSVPAQPPVKPERTLTGKPVGEVETEEEPESLLTGKDAKGRK